MPRRFVMLRHAHCAAALLLAACNAGEQANDPGTRRLETGDGEASGAAEVLVFAQRQRAFLEVLEHGSDAQLAGTVRLDFVFHDEARPDTAAAKTVGVRRPGQPLERPAISVDYLRLIRDRIADLRHDSATYRLYRTGWRVTVLTYLPGRAPYLTSWDSIPAGWRVSSVLVNPSAERLALIEKLMRQDGAMRRSR